MEKETFQIYEVQLTELGPSGFFIVSTFTDASGNVIGEAFLLPPQDDVVARRVQLQGRPLPSPDSLRSLVMQQCLEVAKELLKAWLLTNPDALHLPKPPTLLAKGVAALSASAIRGRLDEQLKDVKRKTFSNVLEEYVTSVLDGPRVLVMQG